MDRDHHRIALSFLVLLVSATPALPCEPNCAWRAELQHRLALAEEHRGWVEFWIDIDNPEARSELGLYAQEMRRAQRILAAADLVAAPDRDVLLTRLSVEWAWHDRKRRQLTTSAAPLATAGLKGGR